VAQVQPLPRSVWPLFATLEQQQTMRH
jgi:hypothetical protein